MRLEERYDDNVFLTTGDREADYVTFVMPEIRVERTTGQLTGSARYAIRYEHYLRNSELDTFSHFAGVDSDFNVSRNMTLSLADQFVFTPDSTQIAGIAAVVPRGDVYSNTATVRLAGAHARLSYQNGLIEFELPQFSDGLTHTVEAYSDVPVGRRLITTQYYQFRYFTLDGDLELRSHTARLGVRLELSPTFSMGGQGGAVYWRSRAQGGRDVLDPAYGLDLRKTWKAVGLSVSWFREVQTQWRGSLDYTGRRTTLLAAYTRTLGGGGGFLGAATDRQAASLSLTRALGPRTDASLSGEYSISRPLGGDTRFRAVQAGGGVSHRIRPWLGGDLRYSFFRQTVSGGDPLRRHQAMLALTATWP